MSFITPAVLSVKSIVGGSCSRLETISWTVEAVQIPFPELSSEHSILSFSHGPPNIVYLVMSRNYLPLDTCLFYSQIINRAVHVVSSRLSQGQALGLPVLRCKPGCGDSYYQIDRSIQPNSCELQVGYNILCLLLGLFLPELFSAYSPVSKKPVWA